MEISREETEKDRTGIVDVSPISQTNDSSLIFVLIRMLLLFLILFAFDNHNQIRDQGSESEEISMISDAHIKHPSK